MRLISYVLGSGVAFVACIVARARKTTLGGDGPRDGFGSLGKGRRNASLFILMFSLRSLPYILSTENSELNRSRNKPSAVRFLAAQFSRSAMAQRYDASLPPEVAGRGLLGAIIDGGSSGVRSRSHTPPSRPDKSLVPFPWAEPEKTMREFRAKGGGSVC